MTLYRYNDYKIIFVSVPLRQKDYFSNKLEHTLRAQLKSAILCAGWKRERNVLIYDDKNKCHLSDSHWRDWKPNEWAIGSILYSHFI